MIGHESYRVSEDRAWEAVAGLTVGQDISERVTQLQGEPAQFSLGKSYPGFGPTGPVLVTPQEFDDPDDLEITGLLNGEVVQHDRTKSMIFPVPELIARLSAVVPLFPGDLVCFVRGDHTGGGRPCAGPGTRARRPAHGHARQTRQRRDVLLLYGLARRLRHRDRRGRRTGRRTAPGSAAPTPPTSGATTPSGDRSRHTVRSHARMPDAWEVKNCRQVGEVGRGAGPSPAAARIRRIVPSPTLCPSPASSPWMRR